MSNYADDLLEASSNLTQAIDLLDIEDWDSTLRDVPKLKELAQKLRNAHNAYVFACIRARQEEDAK